MYAYFTQIPLDVALDPEPVAADAAVYIVVGVVVAALAAFAVWYILRRRKK